MIGKLIIARHNESEWNRLGKWTGTRDRHLTDNGFEKSEDMGLLIKDFHIDYAFASMQVRTIETLSCMLSVCHLYEVPTEHSAALNERDYGDYTAKNKWQMEQILGKEEFEKLRRGWDYQIPHGESLKMVYDRVLPFFLSTILPKLLDGKNVLVVAHGNSLRALIKYMESISDDGIADVEMPFSGLFIYDLDEAGHMVHKEARYLTSPLPAVQSKAQIIATIGPASSQKDILKQMIDHKVDVIRMNFSWSDLAERTEQITLIRELEKECGRSILIILDLPGSRIQGSDGHTYDDTAVFSLTEKDKEYIKFGVAEDVDYIALSFVGGPDDIAMLRKEINSMSGKQRIIAKIERKMAVDAIDDIIGITDAVMIARGDLGNEIPLEQIPFLQERIIKKCKEVGKPVITATQMLLSMVDNPTPTRAEVTDVSIAILQGSDAVMLSEETAKGKYPVEAVTMMEKIILETEQHENRQYKINSL